MDIEAEIIKIQERNKRVELDKAWETSKTRKVAIVVLTYLSCTSWVGANEEIGTNGHFLWALDILLNDEYWKNL